MKEDVTLTLTFWTTSATAPAQVDSNTELMLPVFHNAQLDTFLTNQSVSCQSKPAHQDNTITPKTDFVPHVPILALNASTPTDIVPLAQLDSPSLPTSVLNQMLVDQEDSEQPQDHARPAHKSVSTVLVQLNVSHAPQVMFITELIVS